MSFDLEKGRAVDEALPYPLDAKEIWVSGKGQMHINLPNAPSIFFTLSDLCEFRNIFHGQAAEIERLQLELTQALKDLSSKDEIIEKLKKEFLKSTYERNKIRHGHAWYPGDEDYNEYLQRIDADAHKKSQESLDDVLRGN